VWILKGQRTGRVKNHRHGDSTDSTERSGSLTAFPSAWLRAGGMTLERPKTATS
jgi:hypothetical protein